MRILKFRGLSVVVSILTVVISARAQVAATSTDMVPVTVENFIRAETDLYFSVVAVKKTVLARSATTAK